MQINIQFLRAIAALMVVFYHVDGHSYAAGGAFSSFFFNYVTQFGYAGVDMFFVISGYIMWRTTRKVATGKHVIKFAYSRATRIYLGYWPYFLLLLLMVYLTNPAEIARLDLVDSFFLTSTAVNELLLPVSWTLTFELYFYLCFTILLFAVNKERLPYVLGFLFILIITVQIWARFFVGVYQGNFDEFYYLYTFFVSSYCLEFIAGCFVAIFFESRRVKRISWLAGGAFFSPRRRPAPAPPR